MSRSLSRSPRAPGFSLPWGAWFVLLVSLPGLAFAGETMPAVSLVPDHVLQGGISTLRIEWPSPIRALRIQVGGREILTAAPVDRAPTTLLVGIDLETPPGPLEVRIDAEDRTGQALKARGTLQIQDARYPIQRLTVPKAFTDLDAATLERINREKAVLDHLWGAETPTRFWHERFRLPLDGAVSGSGFGVRRIINGEPRAPHTGLDFTAAAGTPVLAVNAGMVAAVEDQFFAGKAVILDHGLGLYSMYFHLQESLVKAGQWVERGDRIAFVGNTGRTTGAHLHWGARLHGARIDPRELLKSISLE
ncbi:MAG TPA: M23 family metallopeptidase [Candidatus Methylomirabilis sp.]|nr:M23 family metallopeptidase [Candidatus Methylomirabilis sp.]